MIEQSLALPCGSRIANRICKAATTEGLADPRGRATEALARLYGKWAKSGAGLLISGNIMVDARYLERAGNVVVEDESGLDALRPWVQAACADGAQLWAQINHPGRQCPRLVKRGRSRPRRCN